MPRTLRIDYPGAVQYVCLHSVGQDKICENEDEFNRFIAIFQEHQTLSRINLLLYCFLPRQIHLVIQTPAGTLGESMHRIGTAYTIYVNRTRNRQGPLVRGRFVSRVVQQDQHLLRLSRWIHLLPLQLIEDEDPSNRRKLSALRRYPYSSFRAYSALEAPPVWLNRALVLRLTGNVWSAEQGYSRYVREGILAPDQAFDFLMQRSRLGIGSPRFLYELTRRLPTAHNKREPSLPELRQAPLPPVTVIRALCRIFGVQPDELRRRQRETGVRPLTAWALSRFSGLPQQAIADTLNISTNAAVSVQLRTLTRNAAKDPQLKAMMNHIEETLTELQKKRTS